MRISDWSSDVCSSDLDDPYSLAGLRKCAAIIREVRELDAVLGPDVNQQVDKSLAKKREETAGRVAGTVAGSLIPFGRPIGAVTGPHPSRRRHPAALYAGTGWHGFLTGGGPARRRPAPAR